MSARIALVDDQSLVREGLKFLLQSLGYDVVLDTERGSAVLQALAAQPIDIVLSDIRMPAMDGIELTRQIRAAGYRQPIVLLTTFDDADAMLLGVQAGAQGYLLKDASPEDLKMAIDRALQGEDWLAPVATHLVRPRLENAEAPGPTPALSAREISILRLLAGGYSNKEIARSIHLAEGTVKNYVSDILDKLGTRDRTRAVLKAITLHLI
jgi:DNA-binding NarL/FixJ family response regulator